MLLVLSPVRNEPATGLSPPLVICCTSRKTSVLVLPRSAAGHHASTRFPQAPTATEPLATTRCARSSVSESRFPRPFQTSTGRRDENPATILRRHHHEWRRRKRNGDGRPCGRRIASGRLSARGPRKGKTASVMRGFSSDGLCPTRGANPGVLAPLPRYAGSSIAMASRAYSRNSVAFGSQSPVGRRSARFQRRNCEIGQ